MSDRPSGPRISVGPEDLAEQMTRLKSVETEVRQRLPTPNDISAEQSAEVIAVEMLSQAKKKLSVVSTSEKNFLPTVDDIKAEKKDGKRCSVVSIEQMPNDSQSRAAV